MSLRWALGSFRCNRCGKRCRKALYKAGTLFRLCRPCVEATVAGNRSGWWIDKQIARAR